MVKIVPNQSKYLTHKLPILGATAYIGLEQEDDEQRYQAKQDAARQVRDAQLYLQNIFWEYATNIDRFNLTEETLVLIFTLKLDFFAQIKQEKVFYNINIRPFDYRFANKTEEDINLYISYVINATRDFNYDGEIEGWDYFWHPKEFPKALLFTITIMTTIGRIDIY